jgi:putative phosphoesterase
LGEDLKGISADDRLGNGSAKRSQIEAIPPVFTAFAACTGFLSARSRAMRSFRGQWQPKWGMVTGLIAKCWRHPLMRIAIVSDIHDNLTAFLAVLADLRDTSPDLILHGGDLVSGGSSPAAVVDRIRDLRWPGVFGNTDEAVARPETLEEFAAASSAPRSLWDAVREMTAFAREALGEERIAWLGALPRVLIHPPVVLVHASPVDAWRSPPASASDAELESTYSPIGQAIAVYGHIHQPFVREVAGFTVINTGSVSQSFDGDPRASYVLIDNGTPKLRRVEYALEREIDAITTSGLPHADWIARTLRAARPQML